MKKSVKYLIIALSVILVIAAYVVVTSMLTYTDYSVNGRSDLSAESQTQFEYFENNILRYSKDGAFYADADGNLLWSITYEMNNPNFRSKSYYGMFYDENGTQVTLVTANGEEASFYTNFPITMADVSSNGYVAVLMQQDDVANLKMYTSDGDQVLSGEIYSSNNGYPVSMALSSDGKRLALSQIDISDGKISTVITFYDFSSKNSSESDAVIASYTYEDLMVPEIDYVSSDRLLAFGDSEIMVFGNQSEPKVAEEITVEGDIQSVMHNDDYFAVVYDGLDDDGLEVKKITAYNLTGTQRYDRIAERDYTDCYFLNNNEVVLQDQNGATIYTIAGIKKFEGDIEGGIYKIMPQEGAKRYLFITKSEIQMIRLR